MERQYKRGPPSAAGSVVVCYHCNEEGHTKKDCPQRSSRDQSWRDSSPASSSDPPPPVCYYCKETGHVKRYCPKLLRKSRRYDWRRDEGERQAERRGGGGGGGDEGPVCYNCNQPGHIRRHCPHPPSESTGSNHASNYDRGWWGSPTVCYNCNEPGHVRRNCPLLSSEREEGKLMNGKKSSLELSQSNPDSVNSSDQASPRTSEDATAHSDEEDVSSRQPDHQESVHQDQHRFDSGYRRKERDSGSGRGPWREPLPSFVDTHCHLEYVFERYNHKGSFNDFAADWNYPKNFDSCISSFCDPAAFGSFAIWSDLLDEPDSRVWGAFGIHPHNAKYYFEEGLGLEEKVLKCLEHERCIAFGEIGLDYGPRSNPSEHQTQREVLTRQLQLGVTFGKPFVLHCRDAEEDLFQILTSHVPSEWKIHLHCFTGKLYDARLFLEHYPNLCIGITGNVTYEGASNVRTIARTVPLDRLLIETDAPYHTPWNLPRAVRCKFSHPSHAFYVAKAIAGLKKVGLSEVLQQVRENTKMVYGI